MMAINVIFKFCRQERKKKKTKLFKMEHQGHKMSIVFFFKSIFYRILSGIKYLCH